MSTVLVTGALGAIGSWVTRKLVDQGIRVVTYDARLDTTLTKDVVDKVNCTVGDILDLPSIIHTIRHYGVERIIHMAAIMNDQADANPLMGFRINAEGALNVFEAARLTDIKRVVFTSSKGVYDITRGDHTHPTYKPIDEDYPKMPVDVYGSTKLFVENMALNYNRIYGLDCIILRFASTYGPGKLARHGAFAITSNIIEHAMLRKPLNIPQGRDQMDDMVYNKDVANGIVLACFAENVKHRIFHLGTGKAETLRHFIEIVDKIFGGVPIKIGPGLNFLGTKSPRYSVFNIERARMGLGYNPQYDLEAGVKDYVGTVKKLAET